jgi:hypothetical protein
VGRGVDERGAGGAVATARQVIASAGTRPPGVLVALTALLVAGTILASVVGALSLLGALGAGGPAPAAAPPSLALPPPPPSETPPNAPPTPAPTAEAPPPPADPRGVFQDPALRALAEPFLAGPAVSCEQRAPDADVTERVACDLGGDRTAVFSRIRTVEVMRDQRRGIVAGEGAQPGTVVSVRWRYAAGGADTHAGIPAGRTDRGEGVRVRFVGRDGVPRLYFDQDSSGCTGELTLARPTGNDRADLEELRTFWADPAS